MKHFKNKGYDPAVIQEYRDSIKASGKSYILDEEDETSDEYAHFFFVGKFEGKDVIYDAVIYTLRLQHESEQFEIAEHRAAKHFPQFKKITYDEDENGNLEALDPLEEEIGLFMAEVIMELEFGVSLDVSLHVESVTHKVIEKFIKDYAEDSFKPDETLYTFETQDEEA
jgi:hypothetical protein